MSAKFIISEEKRRRLSDILKQAMYREDINLSQVSIESGMALSDIHQILDGTKKKINPCHLRLFGKCLKLEVMMLFHTVGYIDDSEWESYVAEKKINEVIDYPPQRNLDGIFFRVARNGNYKNVCFSDLLETEQIELLEEITDQSLKNMIRLLGNCVKELGDRFNLVRVTEEVME